MHEEGGGPLSGQGFCKELVLHADERFVRREKGKQMPHSFPTREFVRKNLRAECS